MVPKKKSEDNPAVEIVSPASESEDKNNKGPAELLEGNITVRLMPPVDPVRLHRFEEQLAANGQLRLVLLSGGADGAVEAVVAAAEPVAVAEVLGELPVVAEVVSKGKQVQLTLVSDEANG